MIQKISPETFAKTHLPQLIRDFPHEVVRKSDFDSVTAGGLSSAVYLYLEDETEKAYAFLIESDNCTYCCFLAVLPKYRGQGIGTKFLGSLTQNLSGSRAVIAEIENPSGAENADDKLIREKRIRFYEHLGFQILPDIEFLSAGVPYHLAVLPMGENLISSVDAAETLCRIYRTCWDADSLIPAQYRIIPVPPNPQH